MSTGWTWFLKNPRDRARSRVTRHADELLAQPSALEPRLWTLARLVRAATFSIAALLGAMLSSIIALKFSIVPFLWIGLSCGAAALTMAVAAPRMLKLPLVLAACVPFALGLGELMFPPVVHRTVVPFPYRGDALLGWSLRPAQVSQATAEAGGDLIYNVAYSTDSTGFRVSPPDRGNQLEGCLLFFSDSFTFGDGIAGEQTFPYQVGLQTEGRFRVVNLSVPGYGAQQMLAAIERGILATDPPCKPTHVFYAALPHHIHRAAGKAASGPQYRLNSNGTLEYLGTNLDRNASGSGGRRWRDLLREQALKSRIFTNVWTNRPVQTTEEDIALYFAILAEAFRLIKHKWPEAERHVISRDIHSFYSNGQERFHKGLDSVCAQLHFIDDVLPGYTQDPARYGLDPLDLHPTASAHHMVALYLSERVLSSRAAANQEDHLYGPRGSDVDHKDTAPGRYKRSSSTMFRADF